MLDELRRLYENDQALRQEGLRPSVLPRMVWADWRRRRRVKRLLKDGVLEAPEDYYHAAMILQHSLAVADYWQAHQLAMRAVELGYNQARWLAAATLDRWLMRQGKPQKYGTQYTMVGARWKVWAWGKRYRLWDVDPVTSDTERAEWGVPALEVAREWAATIGQMTATRLGPTIAVIETGDLRVEVQDIRALWATAPPGAGGRPEATPLQPSDRPENVVVPEGFDVCRAGAAFGLVGRDGAVQATWQQQVVQPGEPFRHLWRWVDPPQVEAVTLGHRSAVWIGGEEDGGGLVLTRAGASAYWSVWGWLPRPDLLCLAASLPVDAPSVGRGAPG